MCVGKTFCVYHRANQLWKHPHVCGEDTCWRIRRTGAAETPPRAWGRLSRLRGNLVFHGNTPTCVGKTIAAARESGISRKHPHVRGEDCRPSSPSFCVIEPPPRAWGRPPAPSRSGSCAGNTPTCVGKTGKLTPGFGLSRKHPHVRGEDTASRFLM